MERVHVDEVSIVEPDSQHIRPWVQHMGSHAELVDRLQDVSVPTLIIAGGADAGAPENGQGMASRIPRAKLVVLDDAGHGPTLTRPEVIARNIGKLIRSSNQSCASFGWPGARIWADNMVEGSLKGLDR